MDKKEKIEALKLFNEKAEKLENLPFTERIRKNNIKWSMKFEKGKELQIERQVKPFSSLRSKNVCEKEIPPPPNSLVRYAPLRTPSIHSSSCPLGSKS